MVATLGQMVVSLMDLGLKIKCTDLVFSLGLTVELTLVNI